MLAHVQARQPCKALVLSFHGPTGTGKNLVSRIIVEKMYRYGIQSGNVSFVSATKEFPHVHMISSYKVVPCFLVVFGRIGLDKSTSVFLMFVTHV